MTKVDSRDWYCPACDRMCDPSQITNREYHQHCGCFVGGRVQAFSKRLDDINDLEVALGQKDEQWHMAVEEVRRLTAELADLRAKVKTTQSDRECAEKIWALDCVTEMVNPRGPGSAIDDVATVVSAHTSPIRAQLDEAVGLLREIDVVRDGECRGLLRGPWAKICAYLATLPTGDAEKGSGK